MAKFGYVNCKNCGKSMKKNALKGHKCVTKAKVADPLKQCPHCKKYLASKSYANHLEFCQARDFWRVNRKFFVFFDKVVRYYVRAEKAKRALERRRKTKMEMAELFEGEKLTEEEFKWAVEEKMADEDKQFNLKLIAAAKEQKIDPKNVKYVRIIKDTIRNYNSGISSRQIIYGFLAEKGMLNEKLKGFINRGLRLKDYPTNEELEKNEYLFSKIIKIRGVTGYNDVYSRFHCMLEKHFNDPTTYQCPYCKKYLKKIRDHIKMCPIFPAAYDLTREKTIEEFIRRWYKTEHWYPEKMDYYINYYKQYPYKYFLATIDKHVDNRTAFIKKIEDGKRKFASMTAEKFNAKEFVKEVREWNPNEVMKEKILELGSFADEEEVPDDSLKSDDFSHFDYLDEKSEIKEYGEPEDEDLKETMKLFFKGEVKRVEENEEVDDKDDEDAEEEQEEVNEVGFDEDFEIYINKRK